MTVKTKTSIIGLILKLKEQGKLTPENFFRSARLRVWLQALSSDALVDAYNECLGTLFVRGQLTQEEVLKAQGR